MKTETGPYPEGAQFAFSIIDDTDVATVGNVKPIYDLLHELGLGATKTVWPLDCPEGSDRFSLSETLEDPEYLAFVRELRDRGFEITWHGATMESSSRERTRAGLERFRELLGFSPEIHPNHARNRENLYWGLERVDSRAIRCILRLTGHTDDSEGHLPESRSWWGDLAERHFQYARNLTFNDINTLRRNPSMPYRDPRRPLVRRWFSATDAEGANEFNDLLASANQERLEREQGVCIVSTHFGKGFTSGDGVDPETVERLEELAARPGWFPTVGELLAWLESRQDDPGSKIPEAEWKKMQWQWLFDLTWRKAWRDRKPPRKWSPGPGVLSPSGIQEEMSDAG